MSWNDFSKHDVELSAAGIITIGWTCPRCGQRQEITLDAQDLIYGTEIACSNTQVCGERQSYFEACMAVEMGSYKGLLDRPLNE